MTKAYSVIRLEAHDLAARLRKIRPFISTEETRYYLNGLYMVLSGNKLTLVATDGHQLQEQVFTVKVEAPAEDFAVICPRDIVENLLMVLSGRDLKYPDDDDGDGSMEDSEPYYGQRYLSLAVTVSDIPSGREAGEIRFDFGDFNIVARTIDGTFPDYKKVMPATNVNLKTGFNSKYLKNVLSAFDKGEGIEVYVSSEETSKSDPHLFLSRNNDGIRCVLMPMRS